MNSTAKLIICLENNCVINFTLLERWNQHIVIICLCGKHGEKNPVSGLCGTGALYSFHLWVTWSQLHFCEGRM